MRYQCPSPFFFQIALIKKICITFVAFNQGTTNLDQNIKKTIEI